MIDFMVPISYHGTIPVFTKHQMDLYGLPSDWGYEEYHIVDDGPDHVTDYDMEQQYRGNARPVHRYNRKERFLMTLQQLCGHRGKVPPHIVTLVKTYASSTGDLFQNVRNILKHYGMRIYYNRIPTLLQQVFQMYCAVVTAEQYESMMELYDEFNTWFLGCSNQFHRSYFPNMRFLALTILEHHGIVLPYTIPKARTARKLKELQDIWNLFTQGNI